MLVLIVLGKIIIAFVVAFYMLCCVLSFLEDGAKRRDEAEKMEEKR